MRIIVLLLCLTAIGCVANTKKSMPSATQTKLELPDPPVITKETPPKPEPKPVAVAESKRWQPKANDPDPAVAPAPTDDIPDLRTRKNGSDWPSFLGPAGTGVSTEKGIIAPWPKEGLRVVWTEKIATGYIMPAISHGRCFVFDGLPKDRTAERPRTAEKQRLRCLNSETGKLLWTFEYPSDYEDIVAFDPGPRCSPIVDGGRVYIYGPEGMLHCLAAADGKVIWKVDTVAKFGVVQNFFGVGSAPVIEGDLLIAQVGGSPPLPKQNNDGPLIYTGKPIPNNGTAVVAFDKLTGKIKWWAGDELSSYSSPVLATIDGRRWCFVFARGGLLGLDPTTGKVDFHYPWRSRLLESANASNPIVVGDKVLISECYSIGASLLKPKPGGYDVVWKDEDENRRKNLGCHWMTPIHHHGYVYGCSGRHENGCDLRCIELATGKLKWSERGLSRSSLLMVDGHLICLDERGEVLLLKVNPDKYKEIFRLELNKDEDEALLKAPCCWAAPILAHGLLYIRGKDHLVCLELIPEKR